MPTPWRLVCLSLFWPGRCTGRLVVGDTRTVTRDVLLVTQRNVNGLNPLAQVRYRGMAAGKVISITLDPQDARNILVLARVNANLPLSRATTAQLNSQGITGLARPARR